MKHNLKVLAALLLATTFTIMSCDSTYADEEFELKEIGYKITLPGNSTINYSPPSHDGAFLKYRITYNNGNSQNAKVEVILEGYPSSYVDNLTQLVQTIENNGGTIKEKFHYDNRVWGCTYEIDSKKLFEFVLAKDSSQLLVFKPNMTYNTEHKYLEKVLKAMESIELISKEK